MPLLKRDREFRLSKISYIDFKHIEMDWVLTACFQRLAHNGFPSRLRKRVDNTVNDFVEEFLAHPEWFAADDLVPRRLRRAPPAFWRTVSPVIPTFIWVGTPGRRQPAGPRFPVNPSLV